LPEAERLDDLIHRLAVPSAPRAAWNPQH